MHFLIIPKYKLLSIDNYLHLKSRWRHPFHWVTTQSWFHGIIYFIIFLNVFPIAIETHLNLKKSEMSEEEMEASAATMDVIDVVEIIFTTIYTMEFILKVDAFPLQLILLPLNDKDKIIFIIYSGLVAA